MCPYLLLGIDSADPWLCWSFSWPSPGARCLLCDGLSSFSVQCLCYFLWSCLLQAGSHVHPSNPKSKLNQIQGPAPALWLEALENLIHFSRDIFWHGILKKFKKRVDKKIFNPSPQTISPKPTMLCQPQPSPNMFLNPTDWKGAWGWH